ncbi:hypothetical protein JIX56_32525 [Streptomyces sp. CA-210063]|uniref:hypothetical protein n=1 Tax=Streptomyces sp. CA-210063 TaxID=2801029 RepID=UPI00214C3015|nr:hypothetical protein [Streptomyces sp. CA-210063]UUU37443.1 hypothetical protein JIX56_32525 [Streptomyces sp. CA-210063]
MPFPLRLRLRLLLRMGMRLRARSRRWAASTSGRRALALRQRSFTRWSIRKLADPVQH